MNNVRKMRVKNCAEVKTADGETLIIKFENEVSKEELNMLREYKKVSEKYKDNIISRSDYNALLPEDYKSKKNTAKNIVSNNFVGTHVAEEREDYMDNIVITYSDTIKFELDQVIGKKRVDNYYMPDETIPIARRVILNRPIWISGPSGCGKTEFVYALAKLMGIEQVIRVNFHIGITEQHLIGKTLAKDGETYFSYGIIPTVMQNGGWIILDELDYAQPEHNAVLQPILEGKPLFIPQAGNITIYPHPNFRIFATGNTKGRGDESDAYVGVNNQNASLLDRFSKFDFTYTKDEPKIINEILDDKILSKQLMQLFNILRDNLNKGMISNAAFTTRKLQQIAELVKFGEPLFETLEYEILDSFNEYEKPGINEIIKDIWEKDHYEQWKIGDEHYNAINNINDTSSIAPDIINEELNDSE